MSMTHKNMSLKASNLNQNCDLPSPINVNSVNQKVMWPVPLSNPLAISDLAFKPLLACEASMLFYPGERLTVKDYWSSVDSSFWLRAEHEFF